MTEKKITPQQVAQLYTFISSKFVAYYDLQTELADHLANAIEAKWETDPNLPFEVALTAEFNKFGVVGFEKIVNRRRRSLRKKYKRLLRQELFGLLLSAKGLLLPVLIAGVYLLLVTVPLAYAGLSVVIFVVSLRQLGKTGRAYAQRVKSTGKRWLLDEVIHSFSMAGSFGGMMSQAFLMGFNDTVKPSLAAFSALVFGIWVVFSYVALYILPRKAAHYLNENYPEYKFESAS